MKQRVLITGASGFVGFHLIEAALAHNLEVFAAIRKSSNVEHLQHLPIQYTYPDFRSIEALQKELEEKRYDFIIHAAGITKARTQQDYDAVNAGYTYNLFKAAQQAGTIQKMVFLSSLAAVGPLNVKGLINETKNLEPVTAYGRSKRVAEQQIADLDIPLITLRPTAVYGPREKDIFIILKSISRGLDPYIGRIDQQLSFVYVKDLANITVTALFSGVRKGSYNISDGQSYNRYALADITKNVLGKKAWRFHLPMGLVKLLAVVLEKTYKFTNQTPALNKEKLNELAALNWCCSIDKAKTDLQYQPQYNLQKGLEETLQWYKQQGWLK
jgi:nucleoside-diphosphate-sugar epimerase